MITREQAEQAFYSYKLSPKTTHNPEIRSLRMEQVRGMDVEAGLSDDFEGAYTATGVFDVEDGAWKCIYEYREKQLNLGEWTGKWDEWRKGTCYIVEPKPGIYVID